VSETLRDLVSRVVGALLDALAGLEELVADEAAAQAWLVSHGWSLPQGSALSALTAALPTETDIATLESDLSKLVHGASPDLSTIGSLASTAAGLIGRVRVPTAGNLLAPLDDPDLWVELADTLVISQLERAQPALAAVLRLAGVIRGQTMSASANRPAATTVEVVAFDDLTKLLSTPGDLLKDAYGWKSQAGLDQQALLSAVVRAARTVGMHAVIVPPLHDVGSHYWPSGPPAGLAAADVTLYEIRNVSSSAGGTGPGYEYARVALQVIPIPDRGSTSGPAEGVWIGAYGDASLSTSQPLGHGTTLTLSGGESGALPPGIELVPAGPALSAVTSTGATEIALQLQVAPGAPWRPFGAATGSRVEIKDLTFGIELKNDPQRAEARVRAETSKITVTLDFSDADGFLGRFLPSTPQVIEASGALLWSSRTGVTFEGQGAITLTFPLDADIGPLHFTQLTVEVGIGTGLQLDVAVDAGLALGPISASVQKIGLRAATTDPKSSSAVVSFDKLGLGLGFRPPDGAGLGIEAGPVGGGGFVSFDEVKQQYAGALELLIPELSLTAIGLITTKMPDGSKGFSMLVIIAVELPPIQLGFGFTLNKVGGLVGVNRGFDTDALASGLRAGTLDSIMFPQNVVENAPKIINDIATIFPVAEGTYVFGPMVGLGWGTPTLVALDLGLVVELPHPLKLTILGKLAVAVPVPEDPLVLLQIEVVGVFDFDHKTISIDGTLKDSRIVTYPISGDMSLRASYGASPDLALSAGGFNPRFQPPASFPLLDRMAIALATGDNPRLRLEAYFAVTANTVQAGARLDLYVEKSFSIAGDFTVSGELSFDALVKLQPFQLIIDLSAQLEVQRNGSDFCSVTLTMTLSGPRPWHAWGKGTVHVLGSDHSIPFDVTIGPDAPPPALPPKNPLQDLLNALVAPGNWSAKPPSGSGALVGLAASDGAAAGGQAQPLVLHPLGQATVRQRVVPLDVQISNYGHQPIAGGPITYTITSVTVTGADGGAPQTTTTSAVQDLFAPGDFFSLSDDDAVSRPGFEPMDSGQAISTGGLGAGQSVTTEYTYATEVIDLAAPSQAGTTQFLPISGGVIAALARSSAAARVRTRTQGDGRFAAAGTPVRLTEPSFVLTSRSTLASTVAGVSASGTYTHVAAARASAQGRDPARANDVQIVGAAEAS
jgi:hypothetical protein